MLLGGRDGRHSICIKRVSGDTFRFHSFYRQLRQELADVNGWSDGAYRGPAVPGVAPKWHTKLRALLGRLREASARAEPYPVAGPNADGGHEAIQVHEDAARGAPRALRI